MSTYLEDLEHSHDYANIYGRRGSDLYILSWQNATFVELDGGNAWSTRHTSNNEAVTSFMESADEIFFADSAQEALEYVA